MFQTPSRWEPFSSVGSRHSSILSNSRTTFKMYPNALRLARFYAVS